MPRPTKCRMIDAMPDVTYYKPRGTPMRELNEVYLPLEGFEALRLVDLEGLTHEAAAQRMQVSRQTLGRILSQARRTVIQAIASGLALRIHGGHYAVDPNNSTNSALKTPATGTGQASAGPCKPAYTQEVEMEKIAISSEGPTLDDRIDPRFGRAAGFLIVDPQTLAFEYVDNGASQAMAQGAGIQAAETVVRSGAKVVLTGYVGPKAFLALDSAGIRVAQNLDNLTVRQAVEKFKQGDVQWADAPNSGGHGR